MVRLMRRHRRGSAPMTIRRGVRNVKARFIIRGRHGYWRTHNLWNNKVPVYLIKQRVAQSTKVPTGTGENCSTALQNFHAFRCYVPQHFCQQIDGHNFLGTISISHITGYAKVIFCFKDFLLLIIIHFIRTCRENVKYGLKVTSLQNTCNLEKHPLQISA